MKFSTLTALTLSTGWAAAAKDDHSCTYGHLYLTDNATSNVFVMDISDGIAAAADIPTTVAYTIPIPGNGAGAFRIKTDKTSQYVAVSHYGDRRDANSGGFFRMIDTGFHIDDNHVHYDAPTLVKDMEITTCIGAAHVEFNAGTVAVHCDGYMPPIVPDQDFSTQVNTTVIVLDMDQAGTDQDPVLFAETLAGAHHGVAYALSKTHLLHSMPTPERVDRLTNQSLPYEFRVIDMASGDILHHMNNLDDKAQHCLGYHGSARLDGTTALACNEEHAGVLMVDMEGDEYSSRHMMYPAGYDNHRTGSIYGHEGADYLLANFADRAAGTYHIMALDLSRTQVAADAVFTLPESQCMFAFEPSEGEYVYIMTPTDGFLHVLEWHNNHWDVLLSDAILPGMVACNEVSVTVGVHSVFVAHKAEKKLYVANVHIIHGDDEHRRRLTGHEPSHLDIFVSDLPFFVNYMTVAGVPKSAICHDDDEHDDEHDHDHGAPAPSPDDDAPTADDDAPTADESGARAVAAALAVSAAVMAVL